MPKKNSLLLFLALNTNILFFLEESYANVRLNAETNRPSTSTFILGDQVKVTFNVEGLHSGEKINLDLAVQNEFGKSLMMPIIVGLSGEKDGKAQYQYSVPANKLGYYEIKAKLSDGRLLSGLGTRPEGIITFAVVPDPATRIDYGDTGSRFGLQGGFNKLADVAPYLGVRYILIGNDWGKMEPQTPGQFPVLHHSADQAGKRFPPYENPIYQKSQWSTYPISHITVANVPPWALKPSTSGTICKKFGALNEEGEKSLPNFALAQAKAFASDYKKQKSRYYQVTWEPFSGWCYGGTPEGLVKIFKHSYQAIHQGDPYAIVAGPTLFVDKESSKQLNELWAAGLGKYVDALSIHPYVLHWPPETNGMPSILRDQIKAATRAIGHPVPFIGTEHSFKSMELGNLNKALGDIRTTLIMLGEGASFDFGFYVADFWDGDVPTKTDGYGFYWNLNPRIKYGTDKVAPKAVVPAYAAMTYFLDGTTSKGPLPNLKGTQMGYKFVRGDATIDVVWDYYGAESSSTLSHAASVCDWMGNCSEGKLGKVKIGGAPTYFIFK